MCVALPLSAAARDVEVTGEGVYVASSGESLLQARVNALAEAQSNAMAKAFNTRVNQNTVQRSTVTDSHESLTFLSSTESAVKGEWLATKGKPLFEESLQNGTLTVRCRVEGWVRELTNKVAEIDVKVLKEPSKHAETSRFKDGDDIYLYLRSPQEDVYAMVCFMDEEGTVLRFFPYMHTEMKKARFKKGREYMLFDEDTKSNDFGAVNAFHIVANEPAFNQIYVIYSPNQFNRGRWHHENDETADRMTEKEFNRWLLEMRRIDDEMGVKTINILVEPTDPDWEAL